MTQICSSFTLVMNMFLIYQVIDAFVDTHFHHTIAARTSYSLANVIIYEMFNALSVSNKLLTVQLPPSRKRPLFMVLIEPLVNMKWNKVNVGP